MTNSNDHHQQPNGYRTQSKRRRRKRARESVLSFVFLTVVFGVVSWRDRESSLRKTARLRRPETTTTRQRYGKRQRETIVRSYDGDHRVELTEYSVLETPPNATRNDTKIRGGGGNSSDGNEEDTDGAKQSRDVHPTNLFRPPVPAFYDHVADLLDPLRVEDGTEIPFFWHVARGGGSTVKDIMSGCLDLVSASDVGGRGELGPDDAGVRVVRAHGGRYADVDTASVEGVERAKRVGALDAGVVEVVVSPRLAAAASLFTPRHPGRLFALLRHPVDRAVSLFHYLGHADWEKTHDPELLNLALEDYARTDRVENNWMVRSLANVPEGWLTEEDLETAKEVLRRKCLVGLIERKRESVQRYEAYFGWAETRAKEPGVEECEERLLEWGWSNKHIHPPLEKDSEAHRLLWTKNWLDIQLYEYAKVLFDQQGLALGLEGSVADGATMTGTGEDPRASGGSDDMIS